MEQRLPGGRENRQSTLDWEKGRSTVFIMLDTKQQLPQPRQFIPLGNGSTPAEDGTSAIISTFL